MEKESKTSIFSRRTLLKVSIATGAIAAYPAATSVANGKHRRKSLQSGNATKDLFSYRTAVKNMLALPPEDPRNWYRNAFTHLLDCPHGNWWFLIWHRGYLGWFERTCRELSGDESFALPYWDWTQETKVSDSFWEDILDPNAPEYASDLDAFRNAFKTPMEDYWNSLNDDQRQQQDARGLENFSALWDVAEDVFFPKGRARSLTQGMPELSASAKAAVREQVISALLAPRQFAREGSLPGFESVKTDNHHIGSRDQSILESQPHNLVHGAIGGYMGAFLSPVDPVFFMHHCNIDRLWDVWTRKQKKAGLPIGPAGADETDFFEEEFLFFFDEKGAPATSKTARDYFSVDRFDYDFEPGTGENEVETPLIASVPTTETAAAQVFEAFGLGRPATATVVVPTALAGSLTATRNDDSFVRVTVTTNELAEGLSFDIYLSPKGQPITFGPDSPNYAGSFAFFGKIHHPGMPSTFTVAATEAVNRLRGSGELAPDSEIEVSVVASALNETASSASTLLEARLTSVEIGAV